MFASAVDRARPFATHPAAHLLIDRTKDFSFPSDHSTVDGACALGLTLCSRKLGTAAALAAILMAFSRVYVGTHCVGDALAGLALGATVTAATVILAAPLLERVLRIPALDRFARPIAGTNIPRESDE